MSDAGYRLVQEDSFWPAVLNLRPPPVGPWRSWERASMASRRSWVRIPSAPPNPQKRNKNVGSVITVAQLQKTADEISPALRFFQHAAHFQSNGSSSGHRLSKCT